ncbi:nucleolin 1 [Galendromus occidentalis]|uniref:Nucleolin 1 n=1 Tax=Galendromus occidentalis TaxID=34638 RepID=A0AAJ6QPG7_9ACAR|nr:nucleolin 1 [Galendromus occidentalis]
MADTAIETLREEIKEFLKGADLLSASSKKVRAHLNGKFECDFTSRKQEIDKVVMDVLTELEGDEKKDSEDDDDDYSEEDEKPKKRMPPPRKPAPKKKRSKGSDSDEESEEPSDDDDSEDERKKRKKRASNGSAKARKPTTTTSGAGGKKAKTGYMKDLKLSPELSAVMGEEHMSRNAVVKKMYAIVRERSLLDPDNRQFAILDEQLQEVFGQKRVRMFGMLKHLKKHFSAAD